MNVAIARKRVSQPEKTISEVCLSLDGKKLVFLFENGEGYRIPRNRLPGDDGSPITHLELFDHGCAVAVHQGGGAVYDLPWDSIKHYARGGKQGRINVGKKIATLRKRAALTQSQLARRTRLSRVQISRLEKNRSQPSLDTLIKVARSLNADIAEFFHAGQII